MSGRPSNFEASDLALRRAGRLLRPAAGLRRRRRQSAVVAVGGGERGLHVLDLVGRALHLDVEVLVAAADPCRPG